MQHPMTFLQRHATGGVVAPLTPGANSSSTNFVQQQQYRAGINNNTSNSTGHRAEQRASIHQYLVKRRFDPYCADHPWVETTEQWLETTCSQTVNQLNHPYYDTKNAGSTPFLNGNDRRHQHHKPQQQQQQQVDEQQPLNQRSRWQQMQERSSRYRQQQHSLRASNSNPNLDMSGYQSEGGTGTGGGGFNNNLTGYQSGHQYEGGASHGYRSGGENGAMDAGGLSLAYSQGNQSDGLGYSQGYQSEGSQGRRSAALTDVGATTDEEGSHFPSARAPGFMYDFYDGYNGSVIQQQMGFRSGQGSHFLSGQLSHDMSSPHLMQNPSGMAQPQRPAPWQDNGGSHKNPCQFREPSNMRSTSRMSLQSSRSTSMHRANEYEEDGVTQQETKLDPDDPMFSIAEVGYYASTAAKPAIKKVKGSQQNVYTHGVQSRIQQQYTVDPTDPDPQGKYHHTSLTNQTYLSNVCLKPNEAVDGERGELSNKDGAITQEQSDMELIKTRNNYTRVNFSQMEEIIPHYDDYHEMRYALFAEQGSDFFFRNLNGLKDQKEIEDSNRFNFGLPPLHHSQMTVTLPNQPNRFVCPPPPPHIAHLIFAVNYLDDEDDGDVSPPSSPNLKKQKTSNEEAVEAEEGGSPIQQGNEAKKKNGRKEGEKMTKEEVLRCAAEIGQRKHRAIAAHWYTKVQGCQSTWCPEFDLCPRLKESFSAKDFILWCQAAIRWWLRHFEFAQKKWQTIDTRSGPFQSFINNFFDYDKYGTELADASRGTAADKKNISTKGGKERKKAKQKLRKLAQRELRQVAAEMKAEEQAEPRQAELQQSEQQQHQQQMVSVGRPTPKPKPTRKLKGGLLKSAEEHNSDDFSGPSQSLPQAMEAQESVGQQEKSSENSGEVTPLRAM